MPSPSDSCVWGGVDRARDDESAIASEKSYVHGSADDAEVSYSYRCAAVLKMEPDPIARRFQAGFRDVHRRKLMVMLRGCLRIEGLAKTKGGTLAREEEGRRRSEGYEEARV